MRDTMQTTEIKFKDADSKYVKQTFKFSHVQETFKALT